jgi:beta-glucosidase
VKVKQWKHSGTLSQEISERELRNGRLARRAAAEGIVLLKNDGLLPLQETMPVALLGAGAAQTVKGGIGSGDVNNRETISIYQGLKEAGVRIVSEDWLENYQRCYTAAREQWREIVLEAAKTEENPFDAYAFHPFALPEGRNVAEQDLAGAEVAIYVISRISGEGKDRRREAGDYYLSQKEIEDIRYLEQKQLPIILLINAGGQVELTDLLEETGSIRAVLNISQPGQECGHAVADVLLGKAEPGGRLAATWARRYEDYPSAGTFGYLNGNLATEEYREGIYVGYRYFDAFAVKPLFPFGYGLSYTTFDMAFAGIRAGKQDIEVDVAVTNTGETYSGSSVVQIYVTPPQDGFAKEAKRLAGFARSKILKPGETQTLTVSIAQKQLASFSEEQHAWIIEGGAYGIWIGAHAEALEIAALAIVSETAVVERTRPAEMDLPAMEELTADPQSVKVIGDWRAAAGGRKLPELCFTPQEEKNVAAENTPATEQSAEELIPLLYGNITQGASTLGSSGVRVPGSAGETTETLEEKYGIRSLIMADGPAGLRLRQSYEVDTGSDTVYGLGVFGSLENGYLEPEVHHEGADTYYQYCTAFPVGTALAQTWDTELVREIGQAVAEEMEEFQVDLWLAPGMNIQRNPLCGRNFEYYSEDPLLCGRIAAAMTEGVQEKGNCGVTLKHFACNNQEDNRMSVNAIVSERALREIYLRGFEIAVRKAAPAAIMTSYNLVNGIHSANHKMLCTTVAREEWGFAGVIMTDWNTTAPEDGSIPWKCAAAGNDVIMPGCPEDDRNIRESFARGDLSEEQIRCSAGRVLAMVRKFDK